MKNNNDDTNNTNTNTNNNNNNADQLSFEEVKKRIGLPSLFSSFFLTPIFLFLSLIFFSVEIRKRINVDSRKNKLGCI